MSISDIFNVNEKEDEEEEDTSDDKSASTSSEYVISDQDKTPKP